MKPIVFFVDGEPRAKQSFRANRNGHGGFTPAYIKAWQSRVGWIAQQAIRKIGMLDPLEGNLTVELTFFLGDLRRIDLDNLSKAVQDGLNKVTWKDDQQNIDLILHKYVCRTRQGVLVKITENERPVEIGETEMNDMIGLQLFDQYMQEVVSP
jgi:Holliday junction resolvase RusA-like endonuclease